MPDDTATLEKLFKQSTIDREGGGWWQELAPDLTPATSTWSGKPDVYHSYQALLFPDLPLSPSAAAALAGRRPGPAA